MWRGSLPIISGAASMHHRLKCARCSVRVRPPTRPHCSRVTAAPRSHQTVGTCGGHSAAVSLMTPYGDIPGSPTRSMSGSLKPPGAAKSARVACVSTASITVAKSGGSRSRRAAAASHTANRSLPVRHEWPTRAPHVCGLSTPHEQIEKTIGRPVALSALRMRA